MLSRSDTALLLALLSMTVYGFPQEDGHHGAAETLVTDVHISPGVINAARGQKTALTYCLVEDARVRITLWDRCARCVRLLLDDDPQTSGRQTVYWDGTDDNAAIVAREAYTASIEVETASGRRDRYRPKYDTSRKRCQPQDLKIHANTHITYSLPQACRMRIQIGIRAEKMLLHELITWSPRPRGRVLEKWNGRDGAGELDLREVFPKFAISLEAVPLPDNAVIVDGGPAFSPGESLTVDDAQPARQEAPANQTEERWSEAFCGDLHPPRFQIELPAPVRQAETHLPTEAAALPVTVKLDPQDALRYDPIGYTIYVYLDGRFVGRLDDAQLQPEKIIPVDTSHLTGNSAVLTVNVRARSGQIGARSCRIDLNKGV